MNPTGSSRGVHVLVFGASLRRGSLNTRLATLAARTAEGSGASVELVDFREFDVPLYDQDIERDDGIPAGAVRFRDRLATAQGFVIASPEYNASMSGTLKNLIDWTSRFHPQPFAERHGMLMSASPSMSGGNRGLWALRVPLEHLGARLYPDMFSLAQAHTAFTPEGDLSDATLRDRFAGTVDGFLDLAEAASNYRCVKRAWVEFLGERPDPAIDRVE
ncbi:NAD(P)H-dependent oxidoreductase [Longispora sp. K20-0274]|uniref:NADPH-dependent FMN reductase n=1 Tax=Longispora sp. K20-0274 TaxID=3088255 RepID=UPI00399A129B